MKQLIFIRHAKSIPFDYENDYDRILTERGERDATTISLELQKIGIIPDLMIASPAVRTTQTAQIFAKALDYPREKIQYDKKHYSGLTAENLLYRLQQLDEDLQTVIIVGHNPSVYYYMHFLLHDFHDDVPTCSTVGINFQVEYWQKIEKNGGILAFRYIPDQFNK